MAVAEDSMVMVGDSMVMVGDSMVMVGDSMVMVGDSMVMAGDPERATAVAPDINRPRGWDGDGGESNGDGRGCRGGDCCRRRLTDTADINRRIYQSTVERNRR